MKNIPLFLLFVCSISMADWISIPGASGGPVAVDWGDVGGTLSDQTDLQTALDAKIGGTVGTVDNTIPRTNGTGGGTLQGSGVGLNDDNQVIGPTGTTYPAFTFAGQTSSGLAWNSVFGTVEILVGGTRYMDAGNNVVAWTKNFTADAGSESIGRDASNVYGFNQAYVKTLFVGVPYGNSALTGEDGLIVLKELSAKPATNPPTGFWGLYFKSDGLYMVDDAGTETKVSP